MDKALAELRGWAETNLPPGSRTDEAFLRRFLIGCKMRQDMARNKLINFQKLVKLAPEWFLGRDPLEPLQHHLLQMGVFVVLPVKDELGRTLVMVRATINDPKTHPMELVFKVGMMMIDLAMEHDESIPEKGVVVIIDLDKVSIYHAWQMTIPLIRKAVYSWQECYPVPIKRIHFLNCPLRTNSILNIFRKFMTKKLQDRIFLHGSDPIVLQKHIAAEFLPTEYQGTGESLDSCAKQRLQQATDHREWFLQQYQRQPQSVPSNSNSSAARWPIWL